MSPLLPQKTKAKSRGQKLNDLGEYFSSWVELGGRLFSTEDVDGTSSTSSLEKVKSIKVAAAMSFSGWVSAGLSTATSSGAQAKAALSSSNSTSSLNWQANGGDTLLCNE